MQEVLLQQPKPSKFNKVDFITYILRLVIGMSFGFIMSVVFQEIGGLGKISTIFILLSFVMLILRVTRKWSLPKVIILGVNFVLFFLFIHTYIKVALGA